MAAVYCFADGSLGVRARHLSLERVLRARKGHRLVVKSVSAEPRSLLGGAFVESVEKIWGEFCRPPIVWLGTPVTQLSLERHKG